MNTDGRIAYRIKQPRKAGTHRILTPVELLARIAALIPPPRHPFLRYHGVLAPSSTWRSAIVPRAPDGGDPAQSGAAGAPRMCAPPREAPPPPSAPTLAGTSNPLPAMPSTKAKAPLPTTSASPTPSRATFAVLSAAHRARLAPGDLLARSPRLEWSKLLRRTFADDVLVCPRCKGHTRIVAAVQDPIEAARLLAALRIASGPMSLGARGHDDDTWWTDVEEDDSQLPPSSRDATQLPLPTTDHSVAPTPAAANGARPRRGARLHWITRDATLHFAAVGGIPAVRRELRRVGFLSTCRLEFARGRLDHLPPEITPQVVIATIGIGTALQSAIIAVAVMIRGTAKDLARESKEREDAEKATESRFAVVERDVQSHSVELSAIEIRTEAAERTLASTTATVAAQAQTLAALGASRSEDRPRGR